MFRFNVLENFNEPFNPWVYPNYSDAGWQKYMDIGRWSRVEVEPSILSAGLYPVLV